MRHEHPLEATDEPTKFWSRLPVVSGTWHEQTSMHWHMCAQSERTIVVPTPVLRALSQLPYHRVFYTAYVSQPTACTLFPLRRHHRSHGHDDAVPIQPGNLRSQAHPHTVLPRCDLSPHSDAHRTARLNRCTGCAMEASAQVATAAAAPPGKLCLSHAACKSAEAFSSPTCAIYLR